MHLPVPSRFPNLVSRDLSRRVTDIPVSTKNGNSSPLSNRRVTNNQFPRPASLFMDTSAGNSDAGIIADGSGIVAQEPKSSRLKNMPSARGLRIVLTSGGVPFAGQPTVLAG